MPRKSPLELKISLLVKSSMVSPLSLKKCHHSRCQNSKRSCSALSPLSKVATILSSPLLIAPIIALSPLSIVETRPPKSRLNTRSPTWISYSTRRNIIKICVIKIKCKNFTTSNRRVIIIDR